MDQPGLTEIPSGTVHFDAVPAVPLGDAGWYYRRPGFAWGGMGVAACWLGGAVAVARGFPGIPAAAADVGREPDQIALAHLGEIDRTLTSLTSYLARTAARIDAGEPRAPAPGRGPAGPRQTSPRRRAHPGAGQPEPRPGPAGFDPVYRKRMANLPCTFASTTDCATTPGSAPSR